MAKPIKDCRIGQIGKRDGEQLARASAAETLKSRSAEWFITASSRSTIRALSSRTVRKARMASNALSRMLASNSRWRMASRLSERAVPRRELAEAARRPISSSRESSMREMAAGAEDIFCIAVSSWEIGRVTRKSMTMKPMPTIPMMPAAERMSTQFFRSMALR